MSELDRLIESEQKQLNEILGQLRHTDEMCWQGIMLNHRLAGLRIARDLLAASPVSL